MVGGNIRKTTIRPSRTDIFIRFGLRSKCDSMTIQDEGIENMIVGIGLDISDPFYVRVEKSLCASGEDVKGGEHCTYTAHRNCYTDL